MGKQRQRVGVMLREEVFEALVTNGLINVVCPNHKTTDEYGKTVKHLAPGLIKAFIMYLELLVAADIMAKDEKGLQFQRAYRVLQH